MAPSKTAPAVAEETSKRKKAEVLEVDDEIDDDELEDPTEADLELDEEEDDLELELDDDEEED